MICRGSAADAPAAVAILREAALWSLSKGRPVWRADSFNVAAFAHAADAGELVIGYEQSTPVACMLLQRRDDVYWPGDRFGEALYLHKIAVRRVAAGKGWLGRMVWWALKDGERLGVRYLRLDTLNRPALLALYEQLGFRLVDSWAEHWCGDTIVRLELPLPDPRHI